MAWKETPPDRSRNGGSAQTSMKVTLFHVMGIFKTYIENIYWREANENNFIFYKKCLNMRIIRVFCERVPA